MKKQKKPTQNEIKANTIRYILFDLLDNTSVNGKINLDQFERDVLDILNDTNATTKKINEKQD